MRLDLIPTDSLYKFCAILGLSLIVFNTYYNFEMLQKAKIKTIKLNRDLGKFTYDRTQHEENGERINNKLAEEILELRNFFKKHNIYKKAIFEKKLSREKLKNLKIRLNSETKRHNKEDRKIDSLIRKINFENKQLNYKAFDLEMQKKLIQLEKKKAMKYSLFLKLGIIIGFLLSIYGFYNWRKMQIIGDKTIKQNYR